MAPDKPDKAGDYGLVLSLGGAPETPHIVSGLDGEYHPLKPRPLADCGLSLAEAKKLDADEGMPLKLVKLNQKES